jgi:tetratricopeptide (TPR) repeat protein
MTLIDDFMGLLRRAPKTGSKPLAGAEKRTAQGAVLRAEIDLLLAAANDARAKGDLWAAPEALDAAAQKLDAAGAIRRAVELRRDAAFAFTKFAETTTNDQAIVAGYTRAARAFLVAGDIDSAKAYCDRARDSDPGEAGQAGASTVTKVDAPAA